MDVDVANSYLMFMGADSLVTKIDTSVDNDRILLLIKDSYGNAEVPFYTSSFEHILVVDMRYFNRNLVNFIKEMGVTDVLFSMCAYSVVGVNAEELPGLLTQDADGEIIDGGPTSTLVDVPKNLLNTDKAQEFGIEENLSDQETGDDTDSESAEVDQNDGPQNLLYTEDAEKFGVEKRSADDTTEEE